MLVACACLPTTTQASQSARLHVTFTPNRLGAPTTLAIHIQITAPPNHVPSPLTTLNLRYPKTLGITTSGLGIATCTQLTLETIGLEGCPTDSNMGRGNVLAELPIGAKIIQETVEIAILRAPEQHGHFALLLYANGGTPISAQVTLPALLLPTPNAGNIHINIPPVPSVPGAPNVTVTELNATLGPPQLTYHERIHGKTTSYHPTGILLPDQCPPGGFPFTTSLTFEDGSHTAARTAVPCPPRSHA